MQRDIQPAFRDALRAGRLPPGITAADPSEAARRFAVYRNNVATSLGQALARRFPVIERLVGPEFFAGLAQVYLATDPPRTPVLAEWGAGFAGFLGGFAPLSGWPFMADVARIEYARGRAFHAADATPVDLAALTDADPALLRLTLHPSLCVLRLDHPAVSIWAQNQPGATPLPLPQGPEIALILRDPAHAVPVAAISSAQAAFIEALFAGATVAAAASFCPARDPVPQLAALMARGAIVGAHRQ